MQSNKKITYVPAIKSVSSILKKSKKLSKKVILQRLRDIDIYLRGMQSILEDRVFYEDEEGNYIGKKY